MSTKRLLADSLAAAKRRRKRHRDTDVKKRKSASEHYGLSSRERPRSILRGANDDRRTQISR